MGNVLGLRGPEAQPGPSALPFFHRLSGLSEAFSQTQASHQHGSHTIT